MITIDTDALRPLITEIVRAVLEETGATQDRLGDRLGYTEAEAAELLGLARHQLRDARLRREISAVKIGKRFIYSRASLATYLDAGGGRHG